MDADYLLKWVIFACRFTHLLVSDLSVIEPDAACNAAIRKELEGPVDGRVTNTRMLRPQFVVKVIDPGVPVQRQEGAENKVPLAGQLEPFGGDELM